MCSRLILYLCWLILLISIVPHAINATSHKQYDIAFYFEAQGQVIRFDWPEHLHGSESLLFWKKGDEFYTVNLRVHGGPNYVDLRYHPDWSGTVDRLTMTIPVTNVALIEPTFSDEIAIFLQPEVLDATKSNFLWGHTLFGQPVTLWAVGSWIFIGLIAVFIKKVNRWMAVFAIWGVIMFVVDIRMIYDHSHVSRQVGAGQLLVDYVEDAVELFWPYLERGSWSFEGVRIPYNLLILYHLAEQPYIPPERAAEAITVIRQHPDGQLYIEQ